MHYFCCEKLINTLHYLCCEFEVAGSIHLYRGRFHSHPKWAQRAGARCTGLQPYLPRIRPPSTAANVRGKVAVTVAGMTARDEEHRNDGKKSSQPRIRPGSRPRRLRGCVVRFPCFCARPRATNASKWRFRRFFSRSSAWAVRIDEVDAAHKMATTEQAALRVCSKPVLTFPSCRMRQHVIDYFTKQTNP